MKSFITKGFLFITGYIILFAAIILIMPKSKGTSYIIYNEKIRLVKETPSPRIIFVSGSSLYTSLDSKRIQDSLRRNVVNYGFHAGIGLRYMIDDVSQYVRKGDVIVIAPEYPQFYNGVMNGNPETLGPLMFYTGFRNITHMNKAQFMNVITGLPYILKVNLVDGLIRNELKGIHPTLSSYMNMYGDEESHWAFKGKLPIVTKASDEPKSLDTDFCLWMANKMKEMSKKGAKVILMPSVIRETAFKIEKKRADEIGRFFVKQGFPYISDPKNHMLPDNCAWNSDYHMNYEGVTKNTNIIIKILKDILQNKN